MPLAPCWAWALQLQAFEADFLVGQIDRINILGGGDFVGERISWEIFVFKEGGEISPLDLGDSQGWRNFPLPSDPSFHQRRTPITAFLFVVSGIACTPYPKTYVTCRCFSGQKRNMPLERHRL